MRRRDTLALGAALALPGPPALAGAPAAEVPRGKVLRYAFPVAETAFDPAQVTDLYSNNVINGIFESPLEYEFLAKPVRIRPNTCDGMPEVADNFRSYTFRIKPGIFFADDPAFKGARRELVAEDYVYAIKRHYDPRWKSGKLYVFENEKYIGLSELRRKLMAEKKPFDYDTPVAGLRALDRYTFQARLEAPSPRFLHYFALASFTGALAREVVEHYGDLIGEHPVGTGPFRLKSWKRSSRIVVERNPSYREVLYDEHPPEGDARLERMASQLKGRRLPMVDEIHISIIEETQPRWLAFLNHEQDLLELVPAEFAPVAFPNNRLAPHLSKKGVQMVRYPRSDVSYSYFAMENPLVGGYTPQKVALRRAISLAVDLDREIRQARRGQAIPAQGPISPGCYGYDPAFKTEHSDYNLARAKALLDLHGYVDRNGDGWREQPDGQPLLLEYSTSPDQTNRQLDELWKRNMDALGLQIVFKTAKWPENLKASRAGKLMMWGVGWNGGIPDGDTFLGLSYAGNKGGSNHARFDLPAYNQLYERQRVLPDGAERLALMQQMARLLAAYVPAKFHVHRIATDLAQPWVQGYSRHTFNGLFWKYVDVDAAAQPRLAGSA